MKNRSASSWLLALLFAVVLTTGPTVFAQTTTQEADDQINLDTQLYLIVATNQEVPDPKMPATLDNVVKQMRATLPFKNYRLAATLLNRVKNEGKLDLSWIGGPLASPLGAASTLTPSFSQFKVRTVKLVRSSEGQTMVQLAGFNYGARIPIQTNGAIAANGSVMPTFNYENTGLATDISIREGEPVIVGTLNIGPSGDAIILVVSAKRTSR
jgi:hypothetical protein